MDTRSEKARKSKEEDRRLMIKKHFVDKQKKGPVSPSESDSKISESSKDVPDSEEKPSASSSEKRPDSPEPNCAICLEPLTNKSFTDSCFHTFCFTCLVEWSKVKPECPLCKQQFKSIVHNVQSDFSYDEYHIRSRTTNLMWNYLAGEPRFRYPTTMAPVTYYRRNGEAYQETYTSQIESHRMRYAPHAVRMFSGTHLLSSEPCRFRIRVYAQDLWVRPLLESRIRTVTPEFLRGNPACTHRLLPWLNRELVALLQNNETQVTFVLELIMALIARYEMNSQEFFVHIEPYLGDKTRHFIHELHTFATSPYDMEAYDRHSDYTSPSRSLLFDDEYNEVSIIHSFDIPSGFRSTAQNAAAAEKNLQIAKTLKKIVIKKNADNNWETVTVPSSQNASNPGPSTSRSAHFLDSPSASTVDEDEECEVLQVLKPKGERTPEIVDLSSDEEVINVPSDSDNSSSDSPWKILPRLLPTRTRSPLGCRYTAAPSPPLSILWSSKCTDEYHSPSFIDSDYSSTDIECVYTSEQASTSTAKPAVPNAEKDAEKDSTIKSPTESTISNDQDLNKPEPKKKLSSAIVRPWAMAMQTTSQELLPKPSKSKRHAPPLYLSNVSSSSENVTSDNKSPKKLKLRSVVAHFSFDSSEKKHDSSHRPFHKKHKDKKKKKKKHVHRHKHRIYSDSDSS